jgi:hypothetical protein
VSRSGLYCPFQPWESPNVLPPEKDIPALLHPVRGRE